MRQQDARHAYRCSICMEMANSSMDRKMLIFRQFSKTRVLHLVIDLNSYFSITMCNTTHGFESTVSKSLSTDTLVLSTVQILQ